MTQFDEWQDTYREEIQSAIDFAGQDHEYFTAVKTRELRRLASRLGDPAGLEALDVGCGTGETDTMLNGSFGTLHGVDVSPGSIDVARRANPDVRYQVYEGSRLPFDDESVDLAFAVNVVHHVPPGDWLAFLRKMNRVVRRGGLVILFEHNPLNPLTRRVVSQCVFDEDAVLLSSRRARRLVEESGMRVAEAGHILFFPVGGAAVARFERALRWLPLGAQHYVAGQAS